VQFDSDDGARLLIEPAEAYALLAYIKGMEEITESLDVGIEEYVDILTERNAELAASRDANARILSRCMDWAQCVKIRPGGLVRTDEIVRFVTEMRGIAGQALQSHERAGASRSQEG
jgi:hypothetical protein